MHIQLPPSLSTSQHSATRARAHTHPKLLTNTDGKWLDPVRGKVEKGEKRDSYDTDGEGTVSRKNTPRILHASMERARLCHRHAGSTQPAQGARHSRVNPVSLLDAKQHLNMLSERKHTNTLTYKPQGRGYLFIVQLLCNQNPSNQSAW